MPIRYTEGGDRSYRRSPLGVEMREDKAEERKRENAARSKEDLKLRNAAIGHVYIGQLVDYDGKEYVVVGINKERGLVKLGKTVGGPSVVEIGVMAPAFQKEQE